MRFKVCHDATNKTLAIPRAVLELSGLAEQQELALHADSGCVLLLSNEPSAAEALKTVLLLTEVNTQLITSLAKASSKQGMPNDKCIDCRWEEPCLELPFPLCMLAEAGIDPEGDLSCKVENGTLVLSPDAETNTYQFMKGLDADFRAMLEQAGVSMPGLFLLLKKELDAHE